MNKFRNKYTFCQQYHNHASKKESNYCNELHLLQKAGKIFDYDTQIKFDLFCNGVKITSIVVDFVVYLDEAKSKVEIHEVKSVATQTVLWKVKWKILQAQKNYGIIYKVV